MKGLFLILLFFNVFPHTVTAQQSHNSKRSELVTRFPFTQLIGGVIVLRGTFNNLPDTMNFILDTGSGAISLDSTTVSEFNIPNIPSGRTISGIAGIRKVNYIPKSTLHLPGMEIDSLDFFVNDYSLLSSVYGLKIDGVIGYSFLSRYIVSINYDSLQISVFTNGSFQYPRKSTFLYPQFTTLPILPVDMHDKRDIKSRFYLDTGAGLCFLLTKRFIDDSAFLKKKRKPRSILVQGPGGKMEMKVTIIKKLKLGPFTFRKIPTNIFVDEFNAISYPYLAGLVGNDLLRRFNVILNYKEKLIAIRPNSRFDDPFDYSYTGMNLYMIDGHIVIDDILENSPAQKAGLKDGDVLLAVNKDFSNNLTAYKNLMQHAGTVVRLIISRDKEILTKRLLVGRIY